MLQGRLRGSLPTAPRADRCRGSTWSLRAPSREPRPTAREPTGFRMLRRAQASNFQYRTEAGLLRQNYWNPGTSGGANPYWTVNRNLTEDDLDRVIGLASATYDVTDDLNSDSTGEYPRDRAAPKWRRREGATPPPGVRSLGRVRSGSRTSAPPGRCRISRPPAAAPPPPSRHASRRRSAAFACTR